MSTRAKYAYELPVPEFFKESERLAGKPRFVDYMELAATARAWAAKHKLEPRRNDKFQIAMVGIDPQITFTQKGAELVVPNAVDDTVRAAEFALRNMQVISDHIVTLDTHFLDHIFHPIFWVNRKGEHPAPFTQILQKSILQGEWTVNEEMAFLILGDMKKLAWLKEYIVHYTGELEKSGKQPLTIWTYHSPLGGIAHAMAPEIEEAVKFHHFARYGRMVLRMKGLEPLSEMYSPFGHEVVRAHDGTPVGKMSDAVIKDLLVYDALFFYGEALTHCFRAAIYDVLRMVRAQDEKLAKRIYLMEDCSSGIPGFEKDAEQALSDFRAAGMNVVKSTTPIAEWPGIDEKQLVA